MQHKKGNKTSDGLCDMQLVNWSVTNESPLNKQKTMSSFTARQDRLYSKKN